MAGWATLKYFGHEGFQSVLGGIIENTVYLRNKIRSIQDIVCVNEDDFGLVTLLRIYPPNTNAKIQYQQELTKEENLNELVLNNKLTLAIGNLLFDWFRSKKKVNGKYTPYLSFSTGFRVASYNRGDEIKSEVICAIKIFPMNVHITPEIMDHITVCLIAARDECI